MFWVATKHLYSIVMILQWCHPPLDVSVVSGCGKIYYPSSIMNELTFSPSNPVPDFIPNITKHVVRTIDQIFNSYSESDDQVVTSEEGEPSNSLNHEDSIPNNMNESTNP